MELFKANHHWILEQWKHVLQNDESCFSIWKTDIDEFWCLGTQLTALGQL